MRIEETYPHSTEELKSRIDTFVDSLKSLPLPGGVSVSNISKKWEGDRMPFSFHAAKGFFGTSISGDIVVSGSTVILDLAIPALVSSFVNEGDLRTSVIEMMDKILR